MTLIYITELAFPFFQGFFYRSSVPPQFSFGYHRAIFTHRFYSLGHEVSAMITLEARFCLVYPSAYLWRYFHCYLLLEA